MSRGKTTLTKPLEMIINFFTKPKKENNPWKNDLEELAQKWEPPPLPEVKEPTVKETVQTQLSVLSPTSEQTGQKLKKLIDVVSDAKKDAEAREARAQEAAAQLNEEAAARAKLEGAEPDRIVVRPIKKNRVGDATTPDMKAWWGQSVATWDPIDEKNLDSVEQTRRPRSTRWFD